MTSRTAFRTAFFAQLRRDLAEWWPLWAASVAVGLVPLLLPVIYSARGEDALDLRVAALVVGGGLYWLAAVGLLGDGLASRDLGEGRYGFFASRPIGSGAFWLARVAAALALLAAITASLVLPAWLVQPPDVGASREPAMNPWTLSVTAPGVDLASARSPDYSGEGVLDLLAALAPLGALGALVSLLLLAHLAGTAGRSRDAWTLLDFGGSLLVALLLLEARDVLLSAHAFAALVAAERLFVAGAAAVLLLAGWRQLAHGRVDLARGHGALSRTAWPLLALLALALLGVSAWVAHPEPQDLRAAEQVYPTPDGRHALVTGPMAHRLGLRSGVIFSGNGASGAVTEAVTGPVHAVAAADRVGRIGWTRCRRVQRLDCEVWTWSPVGSEARDTGIFSDRWDHELAWTPHGELLALAHDRVEVWRPAWTSGDGGQETAVPRLLYSRAQDDRYAIQPAFLSARRLRYLSLDPNVDFLRVEEVDLSSRSVRTLGELPGEGPLQVVTSPSGRFVAAMSFIPSFTSVLDTEAGRVQELQEHPLLAGRFLASMRFLEDRSLYLLTGTGAGHEAPEVSRGELGDWRLARVDLDALWSDEPESAFSEVPLPAVGLRARLGVRDGSLLLSGEVGEAATDESPRLALPERVEPLGGHALWELSRDDGVSIPTAAKGAWHRLADGARIVYEPIRLAPQHDTTTLIAGDGSVLRLGADGLDVGLEVIVPALPETEP